MTSLRGSLPPAGSTLWQKERRSSSFESNHTGTSLITHIVIREVWKKSIPSPHAVYKVDVMTKSNHWHVLKRYSEFSKLHRQLVMNYGIPKDMLPPKKLTANLSLKHLEKRRDALEHYLQRLVNSSTYVSSSQEVLDFLDVSKNDVASVTRTLAKELLQVGDGILAEGGSYVFSLTQLYCITKQLQLPEQATQEDQSVDLGHLYSFVYHLEELCIVRNTSKGNTGQEPFGHLEFDISLFKALRSLKIDGFPVYLIKGLDVLQGQLNYMAVRHSLKSMGELLVDRVVERRKASTSSTGSAGWRNQATAKLTKDRVILQPWVQLTNLTLAYNKLSSFDESLKLLPALQSLDLKHNEFVKIDLQQLKCSSLTHLDLSYNHITTIIGHPRNIPNIKSLILSHNQLHSLGFLENLVGLIELDIASNKVGSLKELRSMSNMSQLRYLSVDGNPLVRVKSYRAQIFSFFCGRKIMLDNKPQTSADDRTCNIWPTRSRSFSTPENVSRDDSGDIVRLLRANSDTPPTNDDISIDDFDDNDSGIDGYTCYRTDVAPNYTEEELEFNWSYFNFLDCREPGRVFKSNQAVHLVEQAQKDTMCDHDQACDVDTDDYTCNSSGNSQILETSINDS